MWRQRPLSGGGEGARTRARAARRPVGRDVQHAHDPSGPRIDVPDARVAHRENARRARRADALEQGRHGHAERRVRGIRRDVVQRAAHELALRDPRVRELELWRGREGPDVRAVHQQIEVEASRTVNRRARIAPEAALDVLESPEQVVRRQGRAQRAHRVQKSGLLLDVRGQRLVQMRAVLDAAERAERGDRAADHRHAVHVAAQRDEGEGRFGARAAPRGHHGATTSAYQAAHNFTRRAQHIAQESEIGDET